MNRAACMLRHTSRGTAGHEQGNGDGMLLHEGPKWQPMRMKGKVADQNVVIFDIFGRCPSLCSL